MKWDCWAHFKCNCELSFFFIFRFRLFNRLNVIGNGNVRTLVDFLFELENGPKNKTTNNNRPIPNNNRRAHTHSTICFSKGNFFRIFSFFLILSILCGLVNIISFTSSRTLCILFVRHFFLTLCLFFSHYHQWPFIVFFNLVSFERVSIDVWFQSVYITVTCIHHTFIYISLHKHKQLANFQNTTWGFLWL